MKWVPGRRTLVLVVAAAFALTGGLGVPAGADSTDRSSAPGPQQTTDRPPWAGSGAPPWVLGSGRPPWAERGWEEPHNGWEERLEVHREGVQQAIASTAAQMYDREATVTARALMSVAASELRDNRDPEAAWEALRLIFDHQNMDPEAAEYGMFPQNIWGSCWYGLRCYQLWVPPYTATAPGSSASFSQTAAVTGDQHTLAVKLRTGYQYPTLGYHQLQALVNDQVVWEQDVSEGPTTWRDVEVDVSEAIGEATEVTVTFRLLEKRGVRQLPVTIQFDDVQLTGTTLDGDVSDPALWRESMAGQGVFVGPQRNSSTDINSTSFSLLMFAGILNSEDITLFTEAQREEIIERVRAAAYFTIDEPHAQVGYTNARLIRDTHLILVGQAIGDEELYRQGVEYWREWLEHTRSYGIREYGSPVYYGIDLGALMMGHSYLDDDTVRAEYRQALDLFWYDVAANYFPGRESLSGSHSRDYDFTHGTGPLSYFLTIEGWQEMPLPVAYTTFNYQVIQSYYGEHVYHTNRYQYATAVAPVKVIEAQTDANRFLDRYNYITPDWALGSTSETFTNVIPGQGGPTPYDKPINLELAGDRTTGAISIVPSWATDPYGKVYPGSAPLHAPLFPTTAQHEGSLLTQLDLNPAGQRVPSYSTNVLLPASADLVLLDGKPVDPTTVGATGATTTSTVVVKVADTCAGIRTLGAEGINGHTPTAELVVDEDGLEYGMARYTVTQFTAENPTLLETASAPVTFYLEVSECANQAAAEAFSAAVAAAPVVLEETPTVRTAEVTALDGTVLEVATDLTNRDPLYRRVDGTPMAAPSVLTVNGTDYSGVIRSR